MAVNPPSLLGIAGIDYSLGTANRDAATGIRYGVISQNAVLQAWADSSESDYGDPFCPDCGGDVIDTESEDFETMLEDGGAAGSDIRDWYCAKCEKYHDSQDVYSEEPSSFGYDGDGYQIVQSGGDTDLFVIKSPFYTEARFCSPCAPGAGYLENPVKGGVKTYCLGHDWFEEGTAPYPVYSVETGKEVMPA